MVVIPKSFEGAAGLDYNRAYGIVEANRGRALKFVINVVFFSFTAVFHLLASRFLNFWLELR